MVNTNWVSGLWKFASSVELNQILEIAKALAKTDRQYIQIYVRKYSEQQYAIGFTYKLADGQSVEAGLKNYVDETSRWLHSRFGANLVGYDIASPVYLIK